MGPNPAVNEAGLSGPASSVYFDTQATIALTDTAFVDVVIPPGGYLQLAGPDPLRLLVGAFAHPTNVGTIDVNPWGDREGFAFLTLAKGAGQSFTNFDLPGMTFSGWWAIGTAGDRLRVMTVRRSF